MLVDHITFSKTGGAGRVAGQLFQNQVDLGLDVSLLTLMDTDLRREPLSSPAHSLAAVLDNFLISNGTKKSLGSLLRSKLSAAGTLEIRGDSILHFHWIEGVLTAGDLQEFSRSGRKMVWTMHDMAPLTGFCHHSHGCDGFKVSCSNCPQARPVFRPLVGNAFGDKKNALEETARRLKVVVPSDWMKVRLSESVIFRNHDVRVIANPVSPSMISPSSRLQARKALGIRDDQFVGLTIAEQLDDPNKCVRETVETFFNTLDSLAIDSAYILIGSGGAGIEKDFPKVVRLGQLASQDISKLGPAANVSISMSTAESSGLTIAEAGAMGVLPIARNVGGMPEQIKDGHDGYLCDSFSELSRVISFSVANPSTVNRMGSLARDKILKERAGANVARKYIELYSSL